MRPGHGSGFDPQIEIAVGDFTDRSSLSKALKGVSKMFLLSAGPDLEQHETNAVAAARDAEIELVVKLSVWGAPSKSAGIQRRHRAGEERIEKSGLSYVFLRPDWFATNALSWAPTIKSQDTAYGALGETALSVIDPDDIAAVAAVVLVTPGHAGHIYELTGPEALTCAQQLAVLGNALGRQLRYVNVPDEAARNGMESSGMDPRQAEAMIELFQTLRKAGRTDPTGDVKAVLGREPRSFGQWVQANITAFRS
jgi:uncharacterized protein YbjT (DUF2867 family)